MKKNIILSAITLATCLMVLLEAFITLPILSHADSPKGHTISPANTTTATISVSPTSLPDSQCTPITPYQPTGLDYQSCTVTITLNQSVPKGLHWTSSFTSTRCYYTCNSQNWYFSIFQGHGTLFNQGDTAQVLIICPVNSGYWYHGGLRATFVFSGPTNSVDVNYQISSD